jgi:hypothetical protein
MALMEPEPGGRRRNESHPGRRAGGVEARAVLASDASELASDARRQAQRQMPASSGKIDAQIRPPAPDEGENPTKPPRMRLAPNAITLISGGSRRRAR